MSCRKGKERGECGNKNSVNICGSIFSVEEARQSVTNGLVGKHRPTLKVSMRHDMSSLVLSVPDNSLQVRFLLLKNTSNLCRFTGFFSILAPS